ncbi:hypothetical protein [Streptomyces sp. NPDC007264]|uniref:hypothetical protein n=1 Tax=Streptomyces sp. NPDC007264 TaxID=3364777 RepID=UPI0036DE8CBA
MRALTVRVAVGALALAAAAVVTAFLATAQDRPAGTLSGDGRLVLISGRDDHGLVATARVALYRQPGDLTPVAQVKDGVLARVLSVSGSLLQVRTVDRASVQGWVDDFYLRGTVHLAGPAPVCRVRLGGRLLPAGEQAVVLDVRGSEARVRDVRTGRSGWVPRSAVQELAPAPEAGCARKRQGHDEP